MLPASCLFTNSLLEFHINHTKMRSDFYILAALFLFYIVNLSCSLLLPPLFPPPKNQLFTMNAVGKDITKMKKDVFSTICNRSTSDGRKTCD